MSRYDIVIAAFNEERTIGDVVRAARQSNGVGEVIVVDDHSTDATAEVARVAGARIIRSSGRQSKAHAMQSGFAASDAEVIVFFDGDILAVEPAHFEALAQPVCDGTHALVIGLVDYGVWRHFFFRLPPISGLRALRREIFEAIPASKIQGWQIEIMINEVAVRRRERTAIRVLTGSRHLTKVKKVGRWRGTLERLRMIVELLSCFRIVPLWTYPSYLSRLDVLPPSAGEAGNPMLHRMRKEER